MKGGNVSFSVSSINISFEKDKLIKDNLKFNDSIHRCNLCNACC